MATTTSTPESDRAAFAAGMLSAHMALSVTPGSGIGSAMLFGMRFALTDPDLAHRIFEYSVAGIDGQEGTAALVWLLTEGAGTLPAAIRADLAAAKDYEQEGAELLAELGIKRADA